MSNDLNKTIANPETGKDTQSLIIKLWELIRNTGEKINSFQERIFDLEQKNMLLDKQRNDDSKKIHDLEHQVENFKNEIELLDGNKNYYDDIVNSLESELESSSVYKIELDNLRNRYELLELKLDSIQKHADLVPSLKNEIEQKNYSLENSNAQISELQSVIKQLNTDLFNFIEIKKDLATKNILLYERSNEIIKLKDKISFYDSKFFQLKNIESESESFKKHIINLNNQIEENRINFDIDKSELLNKITDYQDIIKNLRIELGSYETQSITLQENNKSQHNIVNTLTEEKSLLADEIMRLRDLVEQQDKNITQKSEENFNFESQMKILQNSLVDKETEIEELKNTLHSTSNVHLESKNKIDFLTNMIETYQSKINNLESKIEQFCEEFNEKDETILNLKIDLEETINSLELQFVENNNLKYEVNRLNVNFNELQSKHSILESQITFLESEISLKKHEINRLTQEFEIQKENLGKSYLNSDNRYKIEVDKLNLQIADLNSEKILLSQRLQKINSKVERDAASIVEKENTIVSLENELADLKNTIKIYDADFNQYAEKEDEYISKTNEYKRIIAELKEQNSSKDSLIAELQLNTVKIDELNNENIKLNKEIINLNVKSENLESLQKSESEQNIKISELANDITIKEITINNLRQRILSLEELLIKRYEQISILEKQINELITEKQKKAIDKKTLSDKIDKYIELIDEELNIKS